MEELEAALRPLNDLRSFSKKESYFFVQDILYNIRNFIKDQIQFEIDFEKRTEICWSRVWESGQRKYERLNIFYSNHAPPTISGVEVIVKLRGENTIYMYLKHEENCCFTDDGFDIAFSKDLTTLVPPELREKIILWKNGLLKDIFHSSYNPEKKEYRGYEIENESYENYRGSEDE